MQEAKEGAWVVRFSGIETAEDAESIVGSYCLVAQNQLPSLSPGDEPVLLVGYAVEDDGFGELGVVREVSGSAAQAHLVVEGRFGQVLVPLVDAFVRDIDESAHTVRTGVPAGLVHLNEHGSGVGGLA